MMKKPKTKPKPKTPRRFTPAMGSEAGALAGALAGEMVILIWNVSKAQRDLAEMSERLLTLVRQLEAVRDKLRPPNKD